LGVPVNVLDSISQLLAGHQVELLPDVAQVSLPDAQSLDLLVDQLRSRGIHIESINPTRSSLEQAFIQVVTERGETGEI
jgi:hypothetical protein